MTSERLAKALADVKKRGRHSPAGYAYLQQQKNKKQTEPTYFKGKRFQRTSIEQQLLDAGVTEAQIIRLKGKQKKKGKK